MSRGWEYARAPGQADRDLIRLPLRAAHRRPCANDDHPVCTRASWLSPASIGPSRMGYHGAEVALKPRVAAKFTLVRLLGTTSRAHSANKPDAEPRAKDGYCPCCTRATHVAIPPTHSLGERYLLQARGFSPRKCLGP